MKRTAAALVALAFAAGCSGGGINGPSLLPGMSPAARVASGGGNRVVDDGRHRNVNVYVTMRIPKHHRGERATVHPSTISSLTKSVSFVIDGGAAQIFNVTTASPNCKAGSTGTTCTFTVKAKPGTDTFVVTTYSATGGGGSALDRAMASIKIVAGKANSASLRLGPLVSTNADTGAGSLRFAIGSANPGDTILFGIPSSSKITVASPLTLNTNVSIAGPGRNGLNGLTISGNNAQQIFVIKAGVTAKISGLVLTKGLATTTNQPGGAIYNEGNLTLTNDALTANNSQVASPYVKIRHRAHRPRHAHGAWAQQPRPHGLHPHTCVYFYGGALYNHGNVTVTGSAFDSNVLSTDFTCSNTYGGAVYNDEYGTYVSSGNAYSNNSAYYGGGVYNDSTYGSASFTNDTFTSNHGCTVATGCTLTGCGTATSNCTTYPIGDGGGIYDNDGPGVTITNVKFTGNYVGGTAASTGGYGGAIYLAAGAPTITGSTFTNNLAGGGTANCSYGYGGAIYEDADNSLTLNNDVFTGNKASGDKIAYGGAIYNDSEPDVGSGNSFTSNQALGSGGTCTSSAYASGGALYAAYGITMSGSKFQSNSAQANYDAWGGAIYEDTASNLSGNTFTSNFALGSGTHGATNTYSYGGAIYADETLRLTSNTFTSNYAQSKGTIGYEAEGGAVYMDGTSYVFTSNGNAYSSNSVSVPAGTSTTNLYGGAVYADASSFISNGDKFTSNTGSGKMNVYGGALYVNGSFGLSNGTFMSNKVTATGGSAYGGGVALDASGTLANSTFTGNSSSSTGFSSPNRQGGGAIYDQDAAALNGLKITGNSVTGGAGGGIYTDSTPDSLNNSVVSGNTDTITGDYAGGGGIYSYYGMSITNSTISGNTVTVNGNYAGGGGMYGDDVVTITGTTISGNKVQGTPGTDGGGGGYINNGYANTFTNTTISNNSSSGNGGGYDNLGDGTQIFNNLTIYQNSATGNGGNIYTKNMGSPYITLANTIVAGGSAASGKDVYNTGTIVSADYNILGTAQAGGGTFTLMSHDKTTDPKLLGLSNNGGPTFTNADQSTSPGKAYIPWTSASGGTCGSVTGMSQDQRGFTRGAGSKCDAGAYEFSGLPSSIRIRPHAVHSHKHPRPHRVPSKPPHERG